MEYDYEPGQHTLEVTSQADLSTILSEAYEVYDERYPVHWAVCGTNAQTAEERVPYLMTQSESSNECITAKGYCCSEPSCDSNIKVSNKEGQKALTCCYCGKQFPLSDLERHERTHTEEKLFTCSYCGKQFGRLFRLKRHVQRIHAEAHKSEKKRAREKGRDDSNLRKRHLKSYTAAFKLEAASYAEKRGNRAAGRKYKVDEKSIREWRKSTDTLLDMKQTKKANRGQKPRWAGLEDELKDWVLQQHTQQRALSTTQVRMKAQAMAQQQQLDKFQGGSSWCHRFMRRKGLSWRMHTKVSQQLPADFKELEAFKAFVDKIVSRHEIRDDHIINIDEVPLTFDISMTKMVDAVGRKAASIKTTGHEKMHFTVVLACTATGKRLPPMVIFKQKTLPKENFPSSVMVLCNEKDWIDEQVMLDWLNRCYSRRPDGLFHLKKALLIMDNMRAHLSPALMAKFKSLNTVPAIIRGGMTTLLQPFDISVSSVFETHLRYLWETWMTDGKNFTATGCQRSASYTEVCRWVAEAWECVSPEVMIAGFVEAELTPLIPDMTETDLTAEPSESHLDPELAALFNSDTEDEDFEGFPGQDVSDIQI